MEKREVTVTEEAPGRWKAQIEGSGLCPVYGKTKMEALGILLFFNRQQFGAAIQVEEV